MRTRPPGQAARSIAPVTRRSFTLVEVLVVVGIIALLLSILLPALAGAREAGRRTTCGANMHQLAVAWEMYTSDHKGVIMPARDYSNDQPYQYKFWSGGWINGHLDIKGGFLSKYTNLSIRACPTWEQQEPPSYGALGIGYNWMYLSYGNGANGQPWTFDWTRSSRIIRPASTLTFADTGRNVKTDPDSIEASPLINAPSYSYPGFHARHATTGNATWADGHVSQERPVWLRDVYTPNPTTNIPAEKARRFKIGDLDHDDNPGTDELFDPGGS